MPTMQTITIPAQVDQSMMDLSRAPPLYTSKASRANTMNMKGTAGTINCHQPLSLGKRLPMLLQREKPNQAGQINARTPKDVHDLPVDCVPQIKFVHQTPPLILFEFPMQKAANLT